MLDAPALLLQGFHARYPSGRIGTSLVALGPTLVVRASLYREGKDRRPAVTAHAVFSGSTPPVEPNGTYDAELHAAECRAIMRALAFLDTTEPPVPVTAPAIALSGIDSPTAAVVRRPPMMTRASEDPYDARPAPRRRTSVAPAAAPSSALREQLADLDALITAASRAGARPSRVGAWRAHLHALAACPHVPPATLTALDRAERRLRRWIARDEPF